jgi:hypothetical protein
MNAEEAWIACVKKAKKKYGITDKFTLLKGPVLKEAQRAYCAMGF